MGFESPPTAHAADLLPPAILTGSDYTIDPNVSTDGFDGTFHIHSRFGDFECLGREMLYTRLDELRALKILDRVSKTKEFLNAVGGAAVEPVQAAAKIATNPVGSVAAVPRGAAHLIGDVIGGMVDTGRTIGDIGKPKGEDSNAPPSREDPIGYNKARNEWAKKLGVDPYTTNRVLALKLNHLAMIDFGTDKVAGAGVGFAMGGFGVIANYLSWLPDVDEHLLTAPPSDVTKENTRRLEALGVSKPDMKPLLESPWFSPTLQTRFVNALTRLPKVPGIGNETSLTASVHSEEEARFLCASLEMLRLSQQPLRELSAHDGVPAAMTTDGTLITAIPADLISWIPTATKFATLPQGCQQATLSTNALLTHRARAGFTTQHWHIVTPQASR